jgi:hypothetical protein
MGQLKRFLEEQERGNPIAKIDFTDLRNQKRTLLETISFLESFDNFDPRVDKEEKINNLTGILHMIDSLQDYAVDELGWDQMMVYDFDDEEGRDD